MWQPELTIGIYKITCTINGECYVGQSSDMVPRWKQHKHHLKRGRHTSRRMQIDHDKHGADAFHYEILEICNRHALNSQEAYWVGKLKPAYNVAAVCPKNRFRSDEDLADAERAARAEAVRRMNLPRRLPVEGHCWCCGCEVFQATVCRICRKPLKGVCRECHAEINHKLIVDPNAKTML